MAKPKAFTSKNWGLWVQPGGPATEMHYLGCHDLDDISEPGRGIGEIIRCFKADGSGWEVRGSTETPPDPITTKITTLIESTADWLEKILEDGDCPFPTYINGKLCPPYDVFRGGVRTYALPSTEIGTKDLIGLSKREEDVPSMQGFEISAWPPLVRMRGMTAERQTVAEYSDINDIEFCNVAKCADDCGDAQPPCDDGIVVADAPAGSPAVEGDVHYTNNGGGAWALAAAVPFAAGEDIMSAVCFAMNATTTRWLVARAAAAGNPAEVAYSDDGGANWTNVNVSAANNLGANWGGALFALDAYHIWFAMDTGYIYFSDDGGESWALQTGGVGAPTAVDLYSVWFADADHGMAVGNGDTILTTVDGGATWVLGTATGAGVHLRTVTENKGGGIWWVGGQSGALYYSTDFAVTWTEAQDFNTTGQVSSIRFAHELAGFLAHNTAAPVGTIYRTRNGGRDWEALNYVANRGLNAVYACTPNLAFAAGATYPAVGGTAVILKASG